MKDNGIYIIYDYDTTDTELGNAEWALDRLRQLVDRSSPNVRTERWFWTGDQWERGEDHWGDHE